MQVCETPWEGWRAERDTRRERKRWTPRHTKASSVPKGPAKCSPRTFFLDGGVDFRQPQRPCGGSLLGPGQQVPLSPLQRLEKKKISGPHQDLTLKGTKHLATASLRGQVLFYAEAGARLGDVALEDRGWSGEAGA